MGLLRPDPTTHILLSPCPSCFLWFPSQDLSGEGRGREKFLAAPRGTAPRPEALNSPYHPLSGPDAYRRGREGWLQSASLPTRGLGSCTPGYGSLKSGLEA